MSEIKLIHGDCMDYMRDMKDKENNMNELIVIIKSDWKLIESIHFENRIRIVWKDSSISYVD